MRELTIGVAVLAVCAAAFGDGPQQIVYRGRITVDAQPFDGPGHFRFALVDADGEIVWTNAAVSKDDGIPKTAVTLQVKDGIYTVVLGDERLGMQPVSTALVEQAGVLKLRIWFDDGKHGIGRIEPDQPLTIAQPASPPPDPAAQPAVAPPADRSDLILQELREIRALLERQARISVRDVTPAPPVQRPQPVYVKLPLKEGMALGSPDAPVTMVEFTDFQCGFCRRFHEQTFPQIRKQFIDTGRLRYISRNLALQFHQDAAKAAQASLCAADQGKYWEMRDEIFKHNNALKPADLAAYAGNIGLDVQKFNACLNSDAHQERVRQDGADAGAAGITGTPSFVIGKSAKDLLDGIKIVGAKPFPDFQAEIMRTMNNER